MKGYSSRSIEFSFRYTSLANGKALSKSHLSDDAVLSPSDVSNLSRAAKELAKLRSRYAVLSHTSYRGQNDDGLMSSTASVALEYQAADLAAGYDYGVYRWPKAPVFFRGPSWSASFLEKHTTIPHLAFLGAAQVFGRGVKRPYPARVAELMGAPWLNFGIGGVGPEFYLKYDTILETISRCSVVFINVFSGRSVSLKLPNGTIYENDGGALFKSPFDGTTTYWKTLFMEILPQSDEMRLAVVRSIRNQLVSDTHRLKWAIENASRILGNPIPQIVYTSFHFRDLDFDHGYQEAADDFPQYVDRATDATLKSGFEWVIDGAEPSMRGYKNYYPSQAHHDLFAKKIFKQIKSGLCDGMNYDEIFS